MLQVLNKLATLKRDKRGVTALEYGLIAALIAVAIISAVSSLGSNLNTTFNNVSSKFRNLGNGSSNSTAAAVAPAGNK